MGSTSAASLGEKGSEALREQLRVMLAGGEAHASFTDAVKDFPAGMRGVVAAKLPYSAWQLVEHLRIAQRDILNFSAPPTGGYQPLEWPKDYWPESAEPPYPGSWDNTVAVIASDLEKFEAILADPSSDLFKPFRWGQGQTLLREALLIADHNAYHTGELVVLRRLLGIWKK